MIDAGLEMRVDELWVDMSAKRDMPSLNRLAKVVSAESSLHSLLVIIDVMVAKLKVFGQVRHPPYYQEDIEWIEDHVVKMFLFTEACMEMPNLQEMLLPEGIERIRALRSASIQSLRMKGWKV